MKKYSDDDGRQVANMDGLDDRGLLGTWFGILDPNVRSKYGGSSSDRKNSDIKSSDAKNMGLEDDLTPEDRRALIKYTLKYSLAIGAVFLVGIGLMIFLLLKLWG